MNTTALLVAAVAVMPTFCLAAWTWLAQAGAADEMAALLAGDAVRFDD